MGKNRCQVCDGPVVNGRCKLCGMPYRNDEILYHLNENRSDHYRHATIRTREAMRQEEIPLGDKKPRQTTAGKTISGKTPVKAATKNSGSVYTSGKITSGKYPTQKVKKKKKNSFISFIFFVIIVLASVPELRDALQETFGGYLEEIVNEFTMEER